MIMGNAIRRRVVLDTFFTTIDTAIDSTSLVLIEQLEQIQKVLAQFASDSKMFIVDVSFDSINKEVKNDKCRRWFQNIPTNLSLEAKQVDALINIGRALVLDSEKYRDLVNELGYKKPNKNGFPRFVTRSLRAPSHPTSITLCLNLLPRVRLEYPKPLPGLSLYPVRLSLRSEHVWGQGSLSRVGSGERTRHLPSPHITLIHQSSPSP